MTVSEYKKLVPEHSNLQGDQLWNSMEDYLLYGSNVAQDIPDGVFRWKKGDPDIELSVDDEQEYQRCKKLNDEGLRSGINGTIFEYTRVWWKAFDKRMKLDKPTSTTQFMIFDILENSKNQQI